MLPLTGITVVALEQAVAAPFATRQLADLGARVIKVERQGTGDFARGYDHTVNGLSSYLAWLNRGKESITLDIKEAEDRRVLEVLLDEADVFVHNLAPGAVERLGFGADSLGRRNPRLISCTISGYGSEGPLRDKKAYDLLIQCEAGLLSVTGTPETPVKVGISIADISAGMYAYSGVLTALYERERTGAGSSLEVAMLDALGEWMSQPYLFAEYGGSAPQRTGSRHASIAPYGPYTTGSGETIFMGLQNEREWRILCREVLERPDLVEDTRFDTNPKRVQNNDALTEIIEDLMARFPIEEIVERLDRSGIANAQMRSMHEFAQHPQLASRDRWRLVDSPSGPVRSLLPPVTVKGREAAMRAIPALGEHTAALKKEFCDTDTQEGGHDHDDSHTI
jgi:itaconate CoA-transferase